MITSTQIRELRIAVNEGIITKEQFADYIERSLYRGRKYPLPADVEHIKDFIKTRVREDVPITVRELFRMFEEYAKEKGFNPVGISSLGQKLSKMGIKSKIMWDTGTGETKRVYIFHGFCA
jgi:UDP-galactopyranose mutase